MPGSLYSKPQGRGNFGQTTDNALVWRGITHSAFIFPCVALNMAFVPVSTHHNILRNLLYPLLYFILVSMDYFQW